MRIGRKMGLWIGLASVLLLSGTAAFAQEAAVEAVLKATSKRSSAVVLVRCDQVWAPTGMLASDTVSTAILMRFTQTPLALELQ